LKKPAFSSGLFYVWNDLVCSYGIEQIKSKRESSLACAAKYEVEHSEKPLEFPTLYAVLAPA
jgi:hypothetical protein